MKVYYGFSKLTEKAVKKVELAIYFENDTHNPIKNEEWIKRRMHVIHERYQTKKEIEDRVFYTRMFAKYSYYIDEKPFFGNIDKVLDQNFIADENHVGKQEREEIRMKLRKSFFEIFKRKDKQPQQTELKFT